MSGSVSISSASRTRDSTQSPANAAMRVAGDCVATERKAKAIMRLSVSAYVYFGVHVPKDQWFGAVHDEASSLDELIASTPGLDQGLIGYATGYRGQSLFLVASPYGEPTQVDLGYFMQVPDADVGDRAAQLKMLADAAGYKGLDEPSWLVIPNMS